MSYINLAMVKIDFHCFTGKQKQLTEYYLLVNILFLL